MKRRPEAIGRLIILDGRVCWFAKGLDDRSVHGSSLPSSHKVGEPTLCEVRRSHPRTAHDVLPPLGRFLSFRGRSEVRTALSKVARSPRCQHFASLLPEVGPCSGAMLVGIRVGRMSGVRSLSEAAALIGAEHAVQPCSRIPPGASVVTSHGNFTSRPRIDSLGDRQLV